MAKTKNKFWYKLLNILTFGYLSRKAKRIAREQEQNKNSELKLNTLDLPDVDKLIAALGSKQNIVSINSTISTIKFVLKDSNIIDLNVLKQIAAKGVSKSSDGVILVVGDCANKLAEEINKK